MKKQITEFLINHGAGQVGFCRLEEQNEFKLEYAVSYTIPLSDAVVDMISDAPTHTYFHHYRSINALIDNLSLRCGRMLAKSGYKYVPVPASQSVNGLQGIFSHKYAASLSGLGYVGKSGLFISSENGPRVRLGTILTDYPFDTQNASPVSQCGDCNICVLSCPATAILGQHWSVSGTREDILDAHACSKYMKDKFQKIGRGSVCGICMRVCPKGHQAKENDNGR